MKWFNYEAPDLLPGLGLLLLLAAYPAYAQTLHTLHHGGIAGLVSGSVAYGDTTEQPQSDLEMETGWDAIYSEQGKLRNHRLSQSRYSARFKVGPAIFGSGWLSYDRLETRFVYSPYASQSSTVSWLTERLSLGRSGDILSERLAYEGRLGLSRIAEENYLVGRIKLNLRLGNSTNLNSFAGNDVSPIRLKNRFTVDDYPVSMNIFDTWYGTGIRYSPIAGVTISGQLLFGSTNHILPSDASDYWASLSESRRQDQLTVRFRPGGGNDFGIRYQHVASSGRSPMEYNATQAGLITTLDLKEELYSFYWHHNSVDGQGVQLEFTRLRSSFEARGHLDPWPITESLLNQVANMYFRGVGDWSLDRIRFGVEGKGKTWQAGANYLWLRPDISGWWRQHNFIVFLGELHAYELNIISAQMLTLEGSKTFRIGDRLRLIYEINQALPVKVERNVAINRPPSLSDVKTRGGTFQTLRLEFDYR